MKVGAEDEGRSPVKERHEKANGTGYGLALKF